MPLEERIATIKALAKLSADDVKTLKTGGLDLKTADMMIENVIGTIQLPLGVAPYFLIDGKDYVVPMALEEPSVVAAAAHAAKLARTSGGFTSTVTDPVMIGQIQLLDVPNVKQTIQTIRAHTDDIKKHVNNQDSVLIKCGGGLKGVDVREIATSRGPMLIVHLLVDVRDAMGANCVNTMCESISPYLEEITKGRALLRIISNLAVKRMVTVKAVWKKELIGEETVAGILDAAAFAMNDPYRAATHNKGVMNGVDAVIIATGNDFRAVEAGAHAYAAINGTYTALTRYEQNKDGDLVGTLCMPLALGTVGGTTKTHPTVQLALKILDVHSAAELATIAASVGLANNFAALRAMVVEGIQKGHMKLHAENIATTAGAKGDLVKKVAAQMIKEQKITVSYAQELLTQKKGK
ncbi:MAG: hydroxymethylglutaryl-CoA reductase, degradative [Candidatus Aenigmarchaeota archaeon]|nr:hydroxymethylglutaryl-CoA reductase, degradative [Candidatus Aenigmarchaeota archaeon]